MTTATQPVQQLLDRLQKVRPSGGGWVACCPAHDDGTPSLSVHVGRRGDCIVKCHGGSACSVDDIVRAVGLTMRDLFYDSAPSTVPYFPPPPIVRAPKPGAKEKAKLGKLVRAYDYDDANGVMRFQVCRFEPKEFRQRQPLPTGGWKWSLAGIETFLFHLPELIEAIALERPVYLVEGEKDAENVQRLGAVSTTAPGGASKGQGKWRATYTENLRDAHVVYLPDNDAAGQGQAVRIANELVRAAASVRIVNLPGLPPKGDVSDYIEAGGTLAQLEKFAQATPPVAAAATWKIAQRWAPDSTATPRGRPPR